MVSSNVDKIIEGAKIKSIPEDELKRRFFAGFKSAYRDDSGFYDAVNSIEDSCDSFLKNVDKEGYKEAQENLGEAIGKALWIFSKADSMQEKAKENLEPEESLQDYYDNLLATQGTKSYFDGVDGFDDDKPFRQLGSVLQVYEAKFDVETNPFERIETRLVGQIKQHGDLDDAFERYLKVSLDSFEEGYTS